MVKIGWGVEVERRSKGKWCFLPHLFRTLPNLNSFTNVYELNYIIKTWYQSCRLMYCFVPWSLNFTIMHQRGFVHPRQCVSLITVAMLTDAILKSKCTSKTILSYISNIHIVPHLTRIGRVVWKCNYVTGGPTMCQMVELTLYLAPLLIQSIRIRHIFDIPTWILPSEVVWMLWVWMNGCSLTEEHNASGDLIKLANGIVWRRDKSV